MNKVNRLYYFVILLALLLVFVLAWVFFPQQFLKSILIGTLPLIILGIGFRLITNQRISSLRNQLHQIINTLEKFDVDEPQKVVFQKSTYPLFNDLNENILELINRIRSNYHANRQFTQNASHELQTPLAIIKGHIEILLNSPHLKKIDAQSLEVILQNTNRLARLNHALILLSKIENNRYIDVDKIDIQKLIEEILTNFKDLIFLKEIAIKKQFNNSINLEMSSTLAEILFTNLFQNAIRYNTEAGFIAIKIEKRTITIANAGEILAEPPETLFTRFKRKSHIEESLGLGLSIVKRICDLYEIDIKYIHDAGLHQLILKFPKNSLT